MLEPRDMGGGAGKVAESECSADAGCAPGLVSSFKDVMDASISWENPYPDAGGWAEGAVAEVTATSHQAPCEPLFAF